MEKNGVEVNSLKAWILAARPKTLTGAAVPVMIGTALALADSDFHIRIVPTVLCFLFAFVMQIDANFVNDYFDFLKGTDDEKRLGPKRACAQGWVTTKAMRWALALTTMFACAVGLPLIYYGGWWMIAVGVLCVFFCFLYTTHLSYIGMGDVLVLLFRRAGKHTLIVAIGAKWGRALYLALGVFACLIGNVFHFSGHSWAAWLPIIIYLPLHVSAFIEMRRINKGAALNKVLGMTARNMFFYGLSVAIGFMIS